MVLCDQQCQSECHHCADSIWHGTLLRDLPPEAALSQSGLTPSQIWVAYLTLPSGPNCLTYAHRSVASLSPLVNERVIFVPGTFAAGLAMYSLNVASLQTMPAFFMASL